MIDVLFLPGTGHGGGGDGVSEDFLARLDRSRFTPRIVPYPATFGGGDAAYADSRAAGRMALIEAIRASPNLCVIGGYSQGAVIAGDLAREIGDGLHPELEIVGVALIADGRRPRGGGVPGHRAAEGYGIVGERGVWTDAFPTFWAAAPGDPITALPEGNPLRTVADMVDWFSLRSPGDAMRWASDMLVTAANGRAQVWWKPHLWPQWNGAVAYARGYLFDGRHGAAYITEGYNQQLAEAVNSIQE